MSNDNDSDKSIDELAREAMEAIKQSERSQNLRMERELNEDMMRREEALKQEIERKIKKKLNLIKSKNKKLEEIIDTRFSVKWKSVDAAGTSYEGVYNKVLTFRIKRGLYLYHLYVIDSNLKVESWQKTTCTSTSLDSLKSKADKILKSAIKNNDEKK